MGMNGWKLADYSSVSDIPGFTGIKVGRWGRLWYLIDVETCMTTGGYHSTRRAAIEHAQANADYYK
jgi:hypothetical protein